ncbi:hypothetical protein E2C01_026510 [Portunus trituberculatus]|uniref:Uncharacterized protein n=1 Tax=Portunus trituberculatus TaxID=210409 RepID=A0A5B7EIS7_PORTR|nr:hypothetical protein [Portunus trituberculatus]
MEKDKPKRLLDRRAESPLKAASMSSSRARTRESSSGVHRNPHCCSCSESWEFEVTTKDTQDTALTSPTESCWFLARVVRGDAVAEAEPEDEDTAPAPPPTPPPAAALPPPAPAPTIVPLVFPERVASFTSWNFSMNCRWRMAGNVNKS